MIRIAAVTLLWILFFPAIVRAADNDLEKAGKLLLGGKYAEAAEIYRPAAPTSAAAALGLARCQQAQGHTDEAAKTLAAVAGPGAAIHAERARLASERGDLKEAQARADEALRLAPDQLQARWVRAELARTSGRLKEAERDYRRLVEIYNEQEIKQAESLDWIGLGAAQYARWNRLSDQFDFLVNELYPEALKLDPAHWPAHYASGMLFMEKYNQADAAKEFKAALELNPHAAEVHAAMAALALEGHDFDQAEASLRRAMEIDPRLLDAWLLKADLVWANFQAGETLEMLRDKVLPLNPVHEPTLGRIAACYLLMDGPKETPAAGPSRHSRLVEEVTRRNAHAGEFFFAVAEMLEARNKQAEAGTYFREAIRVMPRQVGPHAELGLLCMRTGEEAEARRLLKEAFRADPFHVRVKNTLEVLDVIGEMRTLATEHFTIRYDKADAILARYAARHLERIYPELCGEFGYRPPGTTLVKIFSEAQGHDGHQWFSARMVGLPYLGTVAACTGRVIAATSPNEPSLGRRFNWARVLKHEMVHVVTLQQTRFNIPHWFTEGLAVRSEGGPRPQRWNQLLRQRMPQGKLFNLQTVNRGFTRPLQGDDCHLAYCQAELYVEYMLARGGPEVVRKMLAAYTENPSTTEAIRQVFGVSEEEFERGYSAFVKKLLEASPPPAPMRAKPVSAADWTRLARADADDVASRKKLAELALARRDDAAAADWANQALEINVMDAETHRMLGQALVGRRQYDRAIEEFETAIELDPSHPQQRLALADACVQAKQTGKARQVLEALLKMVPDYPGADVLLESLKKSP